jgi:hypothetical protein
MPSNRTTVELLIVIYHYCSDMTISNSTVVRLEGILNSRGLKSFVLKNKENISEY